ncbi:cell division suppressor protein YneA [Clostridium acetireducens DSM 10703]|jgi:UPF0755 protein|uniref:Endolytic murein transglycosylase n=1 Tax=Clostridium acetireducens DSM 10703 TaxID=1121290 RepID=A0A1E8EXA3_9CLOT|nr:endolytic transglycosylase MltG [Clostridium acetireducens]OFI05428.1 cell division suppressor protein YneA [Clostridium acetireducens DSM 10703]
MKNKFLKIILFILLIFFSSISIYYYKLISHPFKINKNNIKIVVDKNDSLYGLIDKLEKNGHMHNKYFLKFYIKMNKLETNIRPGKYSFSNDISIKSFIKNLNEGIYSDNMIKITIPEGYTVENIANLLEKKNIVNKEEFLDTCKKYEVSYINDNEVNKKYLVEGYLYPDTYFFYEDMEPEDVIYSMLDRFNEIIQSIKNTSKINIEEKNINEIITMASIVENEAELDAERDKVASVFYNRLSKNIKLESCATVQYALGQHKEKLYYKDLKIKSPYNTYIVKGLPPGPICSPGRKSIEAALNPAKTEYLYFVSKNDKTHFFTKDYKEFLKVKSKTQQY